MASQSPRSESEVTPALTLEMLGMAGSGTSSVHRAYVTEGLGHEAQVTLQPCYQTRPWLVMTGHPASSLPNFSFDFWILMVTFTAIWDGQNKLKGSESSFRHEK